jgi:hypothetical protein
LQPLDAPGADDTVRSPDPNLVLVLNLLLFGCAGYWLLGQRVKAVIAAVAWVAGLATCGVVSGIVMAVAAVDGYREAKKLAGS